MKIRLVFLVVLIFSAKVYFAQTARFDSLINAGINQIYNIQFDDAEKTFNIVQTEYPKQPAGKFFDAMIIWWKIMLDTDNEQYDEIFEDKLDDEIDFCDDLLDENNKNVDAIFFKGGSLGFLGRLYSERHEWFKAALDGKDALPLVDEAYKIDPQNEDVKLGFGIYNYYAAAIPEKYPFIKPAMIFFPKGNKEKGIEQLKVAAKKAKYAAIESKFFLLTLYYQFEENYDSALVYAKELTNQFPNNPIFEKYYGRIYIKKNDYKTGSKIFQDLINKHYKNMPGYNDKVIREASYYVAVEKLRENQVDSAKSLFEICERTSRKLDKKTDEESGFLISALVYLAKINEQLGNKEKAIKINEELLELRDYSGSHDKAEKSLKRLKS